MLIGLISLVLAPVFTNVNEAKADRVTPAMEAMAEANNKEYLEIKKAGPGVKPSQLRGIHERTFAPALEMMNLERDREMKSWAKKNQIKYHVGKRKDAGKTGPAERLPPEQPLAQPKNAAPQRNAQNEGAYYDPKSGKMVEYKKRDKKKLPELPVSDGIIQAR